MASENNGKLCYHWIIEYDCCRMWKKFRHLGSVDGIPNRVCPSYNWDDSSCMENPDDCKTNQYRLLVLFMCKISEAANEVSDTAAQRDDSTQETKLEETIDVLHQISRCFRRVINSDELKDVQVCLKRHAVLAPLRKNDRVTAKVTQFVCVW